MPTFDIIKKIEIKQKSFRIAQVCDQFDFNQNTIIEQFKGDFTLPDEWNVGVIVGRSGTGKTTIAKELFGDVIQTFEHTSDCVIDDFNKEIPSETIFSVLTQVGFSSPPSWLKPYSVLSNGEKMRIDLAMAILQNKDIIVFDEYTSVVDREIAKIGSLATQKIIRKLDKKFIAVTCHYDVVEWLQPDFIFSTDDYTMKYTRGLLQRPEIRLDIYQAKGYWDMFRKYHYLSHNLNKSAREYIAVYKDKPIAFCSVLNFPHPKIKPMWKIHRIVVLPDYQGIGIGKKLLNFIADLYAQKNEYIGITTSLNGFAKSLLNDKAHWRFIHAGKHSKNKGVKESLDKARPINRNTYSFRYSKTMTKQRSENAIH